MKTRGPHHRQDGCRSTSSRSTPHLIGRGPDRPVKTRGPPHGQCGATHVEPITHRLRPGLAHQFFRRWAAVRSGLSIFWMLGRSPVHHIFNVSWPGPSHFRRFTVRPGPAHHCFKFSVRSGPTITFSKYSARPITIFRSSWPGPARTTGP